MADRSAEPWRYSSDGISIALRVTPRGGRDDIDGLETLAEEIHKPATSLHRMLSKSGNPTMRSISAVFAAIKRALKVEVHTCAVMT